MVNSLAARRGLKRLRTGMLIGSGVLVLLGLAIVLFLSGTLWPSVVAGVGGGAVMLVVSWFTTSKTLESDDPSVAWIALDYMIKIVLTLGLLVMAKQLEMFNLGVVAILLISGIALTSAVQVLAFVPEKKKTVPSEIAD